MKEIKWAVLGCGVIANEMAVALQKNGKNIYAVGNRTHEKAAAFAEKYGIGKVYDDFHEMFTDPEVDVIYITTPHNTHLGFMKEAIANGKHILVEKSITLNSDELDEAIALAKEKDVIIGEAMTIYHMPIYKELKKFLDSGRLGRVNLITMNFGSFKEYNMKNRFFNRNLAGGAMLDIGVYALSFLRWFFRLQAGSASFPGKARSDRCGRAGRPPSHQSGRTDGKCDALSPLQTAETRHGFL